MFLRSTSRIERDRFARQLWLARSEDCSAAVDPWPLPGAIHMWIMQAFGAGANLVCTYRFRQALFGRELYQKALMGADGVTPAPGGREYAAAMRDIVDLREHYDSRAREPEALTKRRTAFLIAYKNRWDIENHKQTERWNTVAVWLKYYSALKSMMAPVNVLTPDRDFRNTRLSLRRHFSLSIRS